MAATHLTPAGIPVVEKEKAIINFFGAEDEIKKGAAVGPFFLGAKCFPGIPCMIQNFAVKQEGVFPNVISTNGRNPCLDRSERSFPPRQDFSLRSQ
jgi:hypothetical protein